MKSFNQLLSSTMFIIAALIFLAGQNVIAQEKEKEAKVVKIKISKQKGDEVIIDTIFMDNLEDLEDMDVLKDIYISVDSDFDVDIDSDKEKNVMIWTDVSDEGVMFIYDGDSTKDANTKRIVLKEGDGKKNVFYIKSGDGQKAIRLSDEDEKIAVDNGYVYIMETEGDSNEIVVKSTYFGKADGEHTIIYTTDDCDSKKFRVAMEKDSGAESVIGIYKIDEDGDGDGNERTIIIHTLEYSSLGDEDKEILDKAGIKLPESHLELKELFFFPNPNEGHFTLSFSIEKKGDLDVKVIDINGKVVHQETFNNFTGKYNKEIDITGNSKGTYFLIIQHGKDVAAHKIIYQ